MLILYGHGSYGMSLSMGSGKLMAQVMQAMQVDIDLSTYYKLHLSLGCCGPERSFLLQYFKRDFPSYRDSEVTIYALKIP